MTLSVLDLFSIGIGPSSSHTVGPMRAANMFTSTLIESEILRSTSRIRVDLFGSLGATGLGHGTDKAVILGLEGEHPESVDTERVDDRFAHVRGSGCLLLGGSHEILFAATDVKFHPRRRLAAHPNGMLFQAYGASGERIAEETYYSIGGGFVVRDGEAETGRVAHFTATVPFPFMTARQLIDHCRRERASISTIMLANELAQHTETVLRIQLLRIWAEMRHCVRRGCTSQQTLLPGKLNVPRRAPQLYEQLVIDENHTDPLRAMDWVSLFALAVNEENAAGGRVVTAPTNGAAGIIPAVLHYYDKYFVDATEDNIIRFLLVAGAIGIVIKQSASISGAEVGCQGEVGSACAMAAAGLCEVMGGTPEQVENAAEIGLEHNLGLTCDPVGGLVQIPCIERNAIASSKAINAARMAMRGDGNHKVPFDAAVATMRETGADMKLKYKETSRGGLAVNVTEC